MKLIAINIAQPKTLEHNGKVISTGIFKQTVDHAIAVSEFNLKGDGQADLNNHGGEHKAVYAFSVNHYDYWRTELNKPNLHYGQFGENLTISDLDETKLCIGDQIQIGTCILEITQPRVPCFKLGVAIDVATMPKLFVQHGATGIYFRVKKTGTITPNDTVERIYQHPEQLSVHSLFNAYFDKNYIDSESVMARANNIAELSDEWRAKISSRL